MTEVLDEIQLTDGNYPLATEDQVEPGRNGIMDRMYNPTDVLRTLARKSADRDDLLVTDPSALKMRWVPSNEDTGVKGHFEINPDHLTSGQLKDYLKERGPVQFDWGSTAHRSLCKMMDTRPERYRKMSETPEALFLAEFEAWFAQERSDNHGVIVRTETDGTARRDVIGFVPGNFNTLDEYNIVASLLQMLDESRNYINGVQVLDDSYRATSSFRVIFGDPVIDSSVHDPASDLFTMFDVRYSPIGVTSMRASLGLWRLICRNGMMRPDLQLMNVNWRQHYSENEESSHNRLFKRLGEMTGLVDHIAPALSQSIQRLPQMALVEEPEKIVQALYDMKELPKGHSDLAMARLEANLDGSVVTEWDMLNLLTRSAHNLPSINARQESEGKAFRMAMQPEAFSGIVHNGFLDRAAARNDLKDVFQHN